MDSSRYYYKVVLTHDRADVARLSSDDPADIRKAIEKDRFCFEQEGVANVMANMLNDARNEAESVILKHFTK